MIQVALINEYGEVVQVISPGTDTTYLDGEQVGTFTAKHIDAAEDPVDFMKFKYWDGTAWQTRSARPTEFYIWTGSWVFDTESYLGAVRRDRNIKLFQSDWTILPDSPLSAAEQADWFVYRQALRDFPATITTETTLEELVWPTAP